MPFLCRADERFIILFARSTRAPRRVPQYSPSGTKRIWRLAATSFDPRTRQWGTVRPLHTGLARNEIECSPCLSTDREQVHASFIGTVNHGTGILGHRLYRMSGPGLDRLSPARPVSSDECACGFWRPDLAALASGTDGEIRMRGSINAHLETPFQEINRVSFTDDDRHCLLITGVLPGETRLLAGQPQPQTIAYDALRDVVLGEVLVGGAPSYKPSLLGGWGAHVQPVPSRRRESWKIALDEQVTIVPTPITVKQIQSGPPSLESRP